MINLLEVFKRFPEYTIMKIRGNFPAYARGQDIDIACKNSHDCYVCLYDYFEYLRPIMVSFKDNDHIHFDIMYDGGIELRFDLYGEFISPSFTEAILDHKMMVKYGDYNIWIAGYHEDILIKSWEYHTNAKQQYKDYAKYINGLDGYKDR